MAQGYYGAGVLLRMGAYERLCGLGGSGFLEMAISEFYLPLLVMNENYVHANFLHASMYHYHFYLYINTFSFKFHSIFS